MFAWIAARLVALGLSETRASRLAPWAALAALCIVLASAGALAIHLIRADAVKDDRQAANLEAMKGQAAADAHAADQRLNDDRAQRAQAEAYHDAIATQAAGDSGDPGVRLACERLRRAGKDTAAIPACAGR